MGQRTLARYLIEEQRNKGVITADLKFLVEVVSRACQAISIAIGKGGLGVGLYVRGNPGGIRSCAMPRRSADHGPVVFDTD